MPFFLLGSQAKTRGQTFFYATASFTTTFLADVVYRFGNKFKV